MADGEAKVYTPDEVRTAVSAGATLVMNGLTLSDEEHDLISLVVNAALTVLDQPDITLDGVMDANYEGGSAKVRSWWGW